MNLSFCRSYIENNRLFRPLVIVMLVAGVFQASGGHAQTTVIPSAHLSGHYDTNIWSRPAGFLPAGTHLDDYVTTVGGAVEILRETRDIDAKLKVGGDFNAFVQNTGLNYFNARVNGTIGLDRWVDQYIRGAKLRVTENFRYTPQSPGFLTGVRQSIGQDNTFFTGIQAFRSNTFVNTTAVTGSYPISTDLALEGGYTFGLRRFGTIPGGTNGVNFFNTTSNTWYGGPRYQLSRNDSIAALYRQSFILQSRAGGRSFATNLITLVGNYEKKLQDWEFKMEAGVTFIEPGSGTFPTGIMQVSNHIERDTVVRVALFREAKPSVFLVGGAILSNVAQAGISHRIYERLTLDGDAAIAYNEFFQPTSSTNSTFRNFTGSTRLAYKLTRDITADISYTFQNVNSDATSIQYQFSRHVVGFFLSAEWK